MIYTIERARNLSGLTQVEMAKKLNMSEKTYIDYEKYRKFFRMDTAHRFSNVTKIPLQDIIFLNEKLQKNCRKKQSIV